MPAGLVPVTVGSLPCRLCKFWFAMSECCKWGWCTDATLQYPFISHHATLQYPFYSHHATRGTAEPVKGQMGDLDKLSFSQELVCMRQAWGMHNVQVCL